jgi:TPP-dependent pyruvate/acetoin dehydrogenase alpha subunit
MKRVRDLLSHTGTFDEAQEAALWEEARAQVVRAVDAAERIPPVEPTSLFEDVFAVPTSRLAEERAGFEALVRDGVVKP